MTNEFRQGDDDRRAPQGRGDKLRSRPWRRRHRRHHLLHQHLQSERHDRPPGFWRATRSPRASRSSRGSRPRSRRAARWSQDYLKEAGLQKPLDKLGFNIVGFGCTTCIGNSGPLAPEISAAIAKHNLVAAAVLSGNRNFEGRVNPDVRANYLASPPLVVAYALAGSMQIDLTREPLGTRQAGQAGLSRRHLAEDGRDPGLRRRHHHRENVQDQICERVRRRRQLAQGESARGPDLRLGHGLDLCPEPALFRRPDQDAGAGRRYRERAHSGAIPRFDHHRPHLARRLDQGREPRRAISHRASGAARSTSTSTARGAAITK